MEKEQIRLACLKHSIDSYLGRGTVETQRIIERAEEFEDYVNGETEDAKSS